MENIRIYKYIHKNCISGIFSKLLCQHDNYMTQFQVVTLLKRDENHISLGMNSFLNDIFEKKISIKTIKGSQKGAINGILQFLKLFCLGIDKVQIIKQSKCFLKYNLDDLLKKIINGQKNKIINNKYINNQNNNIIIGKKNNKENLNEELNLVEQTNNNAGRYYEMYRIFSNKEYGLGKMIAEFIQNFKNEYKFIKEKNIDKNKIDTKEAMMKLINIFEQSIETLNKTFNFDEENFISNKLTFFSDSSEQFILNKIYPTIYSIYNVKYMEENNLYLTKKKDILNKFTNDEIIDKIGSKKKIFRK
jgi:hypothetical protein